MKAKAEAYQRFLEAKVVAAPARGFCITEDDVNPACKPHVRAIVPWLVGKGRAACFSVFGMQKTSTQLEAVRLTLEHAGGRGLIVCPLNVRGEFRRDATELLGWAAPPQFSRSTDDIPEGDLDSGEPEIAGPGRARRDARPTGCSGITPRPTCTTSSTTLRSPRRSKRIRAPASPRTSCCCNR